MSRGLRPGPIRFGTSGWRGVLGREITVPRATALVRAVARWLDEQRLPRAVLVAHDTRPGGPRLTDVAAAELSAAGLRVDRASTAVPTPVAAHALRRGDYGAGLVFTASHNPPAYHGLKVLGPEGAVLASAATRRLEQLAAESLCAPAPARAPRRGRVREREIVSDYIERLGRLLDRDVLRRAGVKVHFDAFHGAGAGVLDRLLEGFGLQVIRHRTSRDARFAGSAPDPVAERLRPLARTVARERGLCLGLATDGDADRYAAVDADGRVLSETQAVALLVDHLAATGRVSRGVAISVATGSLVERVARSDGLHVVREAIGFKALSAALLAGRVDCAGEESGGFVWAAHGVDKDGILSGALLAELVAATGKSLGARLAVLEQRHGPSLCGRRAVPASDGALERLARLSASPPSRVLGAKVLDVDRRDGLRLGLSDGFLMLRRSGTEPAVRIYAEGPGEAALRARLRCGARWLGARPSGNLAI